VAVGRFSGPESLVAGAGPGITKALADELAAKGMKVAADAKVRLEGSFDQLKSATGKLQGMRIKVDVKEGGRTLYTREGDVLVIAEGAPPGQDGAPALALLLGLTAELPPNESLKQRLQKCQEGDEKPQVHLDGSRIAASANSPYAVEILVDGKPRAATTRGG